MNKRVKHSSSMDVKYNRKGTQKIRKGQSGTTENKFVGGNGKEKRRKNLDSSCRKGKIIFMALAKRWKKRVGRKEGK
jgi:hypothetical protein